MAQKKSAFKRLRQDKKKHLRNKSKISEIKTLSKKVRTLISSQNAPEGKEVLRKLESKLDKAVKTKTVKAKAAARKVSRLQRHLNKIEKQKK